MLLGVMIVFKSLTKCTLGSDGLMRFNEPDNRVGGRVSTYIGHISYCSSSS